MISAHTPWPAATIPPWQATLADAALDALLVSSAILILASPSSPAALRMATLARANRLGLGGEQKHRDVLGELDAQLQSLRDNPAAQRRALINAANLLVGGPWAARIRQAAEDIARAGGGLDPAGRAALRRIDSALGLLAPPIVRAKDRAQP